MKKNCNIN